MTSQRPVPRSRGRTGSGAAPSDQHRARARRAAGAAGGERGGGWRGGRLAWRAAGAAGGWRGRRRAWQAAGAAGAAGAALLASPDFRPRGVRVSRVPARPFLTAEWHHVLGVTYVADEALLAEYLPRGAQIDALDGAPRVSLVAFGFRHTRVKGVAIPGHITFPEINLRFYVRLRGERAVVFIREFVPRPAIAIVAKVAYNEPYRTIRMHHEAETTAAGLRVRHRFGHGRRNVLDALADPVGRLPGEDSPEHWLTHHDLGVGRTRDGRARAYRVEHALWALHEIRDLRVDVDFGALYGAQWAHLAAAKPSHVTLATGSEVRVLAPGSA
jgi:uncharacterized protein YqjF (DUF2071 family)